MPYAKGMMEMGTGMAYGLATTALLNSPLKKLGMQMQSTPVFNAAYQRLNKPSEFCCLPTTETNKQTNGTVKCLAGINEGWAVLSSGCHILWACFAAT